MQTSRRYVAVFGSSSVGPDDPEYTLAYNLGRALAQAGFAVVNGGYIGTMEAVSRGAAEVGGHVVGVTCAAIERWRPVGPNPWVTEVWPTETLPERIARMIDVAEAAVALPGGVGTWTEVFLFWNHLFIAAIPRRPLILLGEGWQPVLETLFRLFDRHFPPRARTLVAFARTPEEVLVHLSAPVS